MLHCGGGRSSSRAPGADLGALRAPAARTTTARTISGTAAIRPSHETDVKIDPDLAGVPAQSSLQVVKCNGDD